MNNILHYLCPSCNLVDHIPNFENCPLDNRQILWSDIMSFIRVKIAYNPGSTILR